MLVNIRGPSAASKAEFCAVYYLSRQLFAQTIPMLSFNINYRSIFSANRTGLYVFGPHLTLRVKGSDRNKMSNMENLETQLSEKERQMDVYEQSLASLKLEQRKREAGGYAVMAAAMGYGEGALGTARFGKISHAAKLFCIGFAMLVPSLLVWRVLL